MIESGDPPAQGSQRDSMLSRFVSGSGDRPGVVRTILAADGILVATVVAGWLVVQLRHIILEAVIAAFAAMLLNPFVRLLQQRRLRRGAAAGLVFAAGVLVLLGLAGLFGYPLVTAVTHFAKEIPKLVSDAEHHRGRIGHLIGRYHIDSWVKKNAPKLTDLAKKISAPALSIGKATISALTTLVTMAMLTLLIMLEAPKISRSILSSVRLDRAERMKATGKAIERAAVGYMFGDMLTSAIAGVVMLVFMLILGVPFAVLLAGWVALVDMLPLVGGLLAGIVVVIVALIHSLVAGIVILVAFLVYQQVENHVLNPVVMSKTVRVSPLWVLVAVLVGVNLGGEIDSAIGAFFGAIMAIPAAGAIQVIGREVSATVRQRREARSVSPVQVAGDDHGGSVEPAAPAASAGSVELAASAGSGSPVEPAGL